MRLRIAQDVSALPTWGFSTRSTPWWGTIAFFAIEGTAFALAIGTYVYLYTINAEWPLGAPSQSLARHPDDRRAAREHLAKSLDQPRRACAGAP